MILVIGSTGHIGREVVPQLLEKGQQVRVLVRDARKVAHLDPAVHRCVGDLNDAGALVAAMQGVEKVFFLTFETAQDIRVLDAAKRARVQHLVKLSSLEATDHEIQLGKWHFERDELLRKSGLPWTILRPGMFMSNAVDWWANSIREQGAVYFPGGKGKAAPIAPGDVAAVAVAALMGSVHHSQIYELTGSELLTMGEMVAVIGRVLGKPLRYTNVPPLAAKMWMLKAGMDKPLVNALMEMLVYLRKNKGAIVRPTFSQLMGRLPQTFEAWCQAQVEAFQ